MKNTIYLLLLGFLVITNAAIAQTVSYGNTSGNSYSSPTNAFAASYNGQCTWYAWGRAHEKMSANITSRRHAKYWYGDETNYQKGSTPRSNSIIVWSGGTYGHVAFVESVSGNNITIREANWVNHTPSNPNQYAAGTPTG